MKCPYCASEIADEALVCAVCRRDLYLVKPLLERIASLEEQLAARPLVGGDSATGETSTVEPQVGGFPSEPVDVPRSLPIALLCLALPLLFLLLGHWLFVFVYDAKVLYLRIFALLLPLPFGFVFARASRVSLGLGVVVAFLMAGGAVFGMSGITGWLDGVPVLPQNMVEVREFLEFAASIGFSFTTGFWLNHWAERRQFQRQLALERMRAAGVSGLGGKLTDSLTRWNDLGSAAVAFVTTVMSIYTGLKGLAE